MARFERADVFEADGDSAFPVGDILRGERATIGKSLEDVQRELRIKSEYIDAIENLDTSIFETPGFVSGYVRSYARYLGMNPDEVFHRFCDEAQFSPPVRLETTSARVAKKPSGLSGAAFAGHSNLEKERWWERISPSAIGSLAVLLCILGGLGAGGYYVFTEVQQVRLAPTPIAPTIADAGPELNSSGAATVEVSAIATTEEEVSSPLVPVTEFYRPELLSTPVVAPRDGPISQIAIGEDLRGTVDTGSAESAENAQTPQVTVDVATGIEVFAKEPAWISVSVPNQGTLFEQILEANTRYRVPETVLNAVLRAGNSGSVYLVVDGTAFGPLGDSTRVAKNVPLNANDITQTYASTSDPIGYDPNATPVNVAQTQ
ncbi:MAG: RodZ domain-containing protein [Pseudomonadota bacterium]